ncbi:MAG: DMT family transporter [Gemmobacter sp.]|jgi:drug/metabolite transporter (DMT)-like permease|nr:DMT family transporter [Gemmobacter sp.]
MTRAASGNTDRSPLFWLAAPYVFVLLWSGGYAFAKMGLAHVEPMSMLALRYALAVLVLIPVALLHRPRWPAGLRHWAVVAVTGFLIQCVYFGLAYLAMKRGMNAGTAAIIMALQPALVAVLGPLAGGRRGGRFLWLGLLLGFAGVVLAVGADGSLGPSPRGAALLALGALAGMTTATLFEKWHGMKTDPIAGGIIQYVVGLAVLLPVAATTESLTIDWQPELVIALAYLVLANSLVSIGLYIALIQRGDATRISSLMYLVPPLAMVLAWVLLGEPLSLVSLAGLALAAVGVYIVTRQTG